MTYNPAMLKTFTTASLEAILNNYLRLDPQSFAKLNKFAGKVILLALPEWNIEFYLLITTNGLVFLNQYEGQADTVIKGSPFALLQLATSHQANFAEASVEGDLELGQQIRTLLKNIDIDWEEYLAKLTGDIVANQIGSLTRHLFDWGKEIKNNLRQDFSDYLIEESRQLPHRLEVEDFLEQVSVTRDAVERLQRKFELYCNSLAPTEEIDLL